MRIHLLPYRWFLAPSFPKSGSQSVQRKRRIAAPSSILSDIQKTCGENTLLSPHILSPYCKARYGLFASLLASRNFGTFCDILLAPYARVGYTEAYKKEGLSSEGPPHNVKQQHTRGSDRASDCRKRRQTIFGSLLSHNTCRWKRTKTRPFL